MACKMYYVMIHIFLGFECLNSLMDHHSWSDVKKSSSVELTAWLEIRLKYVYRLSSSFIKLLSQDVSCYGTHQSQLSPSCRQIQILKVRNK
jgi:hypothetical protein